MPNATWSESGMPNATWNESVMAGAEATRALWGRVILGEKGARSHRPREDGRPATD